ncbi:ribonuclease H-like domain-containing protein [Rhizophagus clarus]|uniref:Ribonuclease H-like domain-containing protein n=1 Tax=Rhizophagus clarus TaxID=94130 RepID=A0A8H3QFB8_9GLOM|nr:ribonuclease H-like domain-containing protein [Rhizophagus clarus]
MEASLTIGKIKKARIYTRGSQHTQKCCLVTPVTLTDSHSCTDMNVVTVQTQPISEEGQLIHNEWKVILTIGVDNHSSTREHALSANSPAADLELSAHAQNTPAVNISINGSDLPGKNDLTITNNMTTGETLNFYTNRSLQQGPINNTLSHYAADNITSDMGAGVYLEMQNNTVLIMSARVAFWPSSTRAEFVAIFLALLVTLSDTAVRIHTDSQCAISAINNWDDPRTRARMKQPNALVIMKIKMVCKEKQLDLKLVKVKGHDGNKGNEAADRLAKEGLNSDNIFDSRIDFTNHDIRFFPAFKDIPIETNLRHFILRIFNTFDTTKWSLLNINHEECTPFKPGASAMQTDAIQSLFMHWLQQRKRNLDSSHELYCLRGQMGPDSRTTFKGFLLYHYSMPGSRPT